MLHSRSHSCSLMEVTGLQAPGTVPLPLASHTKQVSESTVGSLSGGYRHRVVCEQ